MWIIEYEVTGHGVFPTDMLRYDTSYPAKDAGLILTPESWSNSFLEARTVLLRHRDTSKGWSPTVDRWNSFGWLVSQNSIRSWKA